MIIIIILHGVDNDDNGNHDNDSDHDDNDHDNDNGIANIATVINLLRCDWPRSMTTIWFSTLLVAIDLGQWQQLQFQSSAFVEATISDSCSNMDWSYICLETDLKLILNADRKLILNADLKLILSDDLKLILNPDRKLILRLFVGRICWS